MNSGPDRCSSLLGDAGLSPRTIRPPPPRREDDKLLSRFGRHFQSGGALQRRAASAPPTSLTSPPVPDPGVSDAIVARMILISELISNFSQFRGVLGLPSASGAHVRPSDTEVRSGRRSALAVPQRLMLIRLIRGPYRSVAPGATS